MKVFAFFLTLFVSTLVYGYDWDQKADFGGLARHRTTALAIGNYVYFGLGHFNGAGPNILFEDWWEYDPATNAWTQKADYGGGLMYHASGFTIGNLGYVGTGRAPGSVLVQTFYSYDPTTNMWTQLANFPGSGRRGGVGFTIDGYGYMGTGTYNSDFYRYDPGNDTWTAIASMPTVGRISAVGFELGGYGYVGTGNAGGASNDFWRYDPSTDQWTQMANVGPIPRQEASGFAVNGKGYILTGDNFSSGTNYGDMWEYDPATDTWVQLEDFPGNARRYLSCVTLGDIVYAGLGTNGTNFKDFWAFDQVASTLERNIEDIEITAYPNPTTEFINLDLDGLSEEYFNKIEVRIYTLTGQKVKTAFVSNVAMKMDVSDLSRGTYILELAYKDMPLKTNKISIQ